MRLILLAISVLIGFTFVACAPLIKVSGYVPLETELTKLKLGESTKSEVRLCLIIRMESCLSGASPNRFREMS